MNRDNISGKLIVMLAAAAVLMCGCDTEIEYPEGVDTLPSFTVPAGTAATIYDTPAPPETPTMRSSVTTAEQISESSEDVFSSDITTPPVTEDTSAVSDTTPAPLKLEEIPEVGLSEYYEKTQTLPTYAVQTEFSPTVISEIRPADVTSPTVTGQTSAAASEALPYSSVSSGAAAQTVLTASVGGTAESTGTVTAVQTPAAEQVTVNAYEAAGANLLEDNRVSAYTGKKVLSHPYSYYTLSQKHRSLYDKLVSAQLAHTEKLDFSVSEEITFDELFDVYQQIYNDEYRLFYISPTIEYIVDPDTKYVVQMKLAYTHSAEETAAMRQRISSAADAILSGITPDMSEYDIVKLIHDSVIVSCTYSKDAENPNNIYGCLVDKKALCQAYSQTFTYLCHMAGIDTFVVLGVANEVHMWNIVKMDGEYYHIDLTWDDPDRDRNPDSVRYDYFGLTDERIRQLRQVDDYDYDIPAAEGTRYQYYYYNNLVADSTEEAKQIIAAQALEAARTKASTVQFMCTSGEVFDAVTAQLFGNTGENVISVLDSVKDSAANRYNTESVYHNSNRSTLTVKIFLDYLD
ncbi:MAG: hypothetical protein NC120_08955 [Ruminococcus sp.]|nr:hypothetical protein [Ruminococcus sp.]